MRKVLHVFVPRSCATNPLLADDPVLHRQIHQLRQSAASRRRPGAPRLTERGRETLHMKKFTVE